MAKMFYSAEEAALRLGKTLEELKQLVREGTLREFRDAGTVNYKVDEVDGMAAPGESAGGSESGEIMLEPGEESGIELAASGSDILSLEEDGEPSPGDTGDTAAGTKASERKKKGSTVIPSVGVNVFDDDEVDEVVDPLAQTAVTDVAGLGLEGSGSGSGILDLTRESDDTSLGAELLEEIYSSESEGEGDAVEMGEDTRAGLEEAVTEETPSEEEVFEAAEGAAPVRAVVSRVEYRPNAVSTSLTVLMMVAVVVMWFAGLAGAALVRGIAPSILRGVYANLAIYAGGALVVAGLAAAVTYFLAKRSE